MLALAACAVLCHSTLNLSALWAKSSSDHAVQEHPKKRKLPGFMQNVPQKMVLPKAPFVASQKSPFAKPAAKNRQPYWYETQLI